MEPQKRRSLFLSELAFSVETEKAYLSRKVAYVILRLSGTGEAGHGARRLSPAVPESSHRQFQLMARFIGRTYLIKAMTQGALQYIITPTDHFQPSLTLMTK